MEVAGSLDNSSEPIHNDGIWAAAAQDGPSVKAEQACVECRRRKAKCDKTLPTCTLCTKYATPCVYEKQFRTPLTRKRMTELERRLDKAERVIMQLRMANMANSSHAPADPAVVSESISMLDDLPSSSSRYNAITNSHVPVAAAPLGSPLQDENYIITPATVAATLEENDASNPLDTPPVVTDAFEWNEQHMGELGGSPPGQVHESSPEEPDIKPKFTVADGMASLSLGTSDVGYLGSASSAAVLRFLKPHASDRSPLPSLTDTPGVATSATAGTVGTETTMAHWSMPPALLEQPDPNRHIADTMINAYFSLYHVSYPIVHEPTFRAQFSELIPRPNGDCWKFLAYVVAAVGIFTTEKPHSATEMTLFAQAKSLMHLSYLESGNITLIQALALMSNYLQRKDMPNSAYNYMGLASRMALGLGLHKEFHGWQISPLKLEMRRRVWWCVAVFDIGATITYGRPVSWPAGGVDAALPLNIDDSFLTAASTKHPAPAEHFTVYTTIKFLSSLYLAIMPIYARIISTPLPSAKEILELDDRYISPWCAHLPPYLSSDYNSPSRYRTSHAIVLWKCQNFRIIMYRPFVLKKLRQVQSGGRLGVVAEESLAYERCLREATSTIQLVDRFWASNEPTRLGAWYALYFLFQAALIPCMSLLCYSSDASPEREERIKEVVTCIRLMELLSDVQPNAKKCRDVICNLCKDYILGDDALTSNADRDDNSEEMSDLTHVQVTSLYQMMWSQDPTVQQGNGLQEDAWMSFLDDAYDFQLP